MVKLGAGSPTLWVNPGAEEVPFSRNMNPKESTAIMQITVPRTSFSKTEKGFLLLKREYLQSEIYKSAKASEKLEGAGEEHNPDDN